MKTAHQGFTLIELLITVAIIAILASVATPRYQNYVLKGEIKEAQSNLVALSLAVEASFQRSLAYPKESLTQDARTDADGSITKVFPAWSPSSKPNTIEYKYDSTISDQYSIQAKHKATGCIYKLDQKGERTVDNITAKCDAGARWKN